MSTISSIVMSSTRSILSMIPITTERQTTRTSGPEDSRRSSSIVRESTIGDGDTDVCCLGRTQNTLAHLGFSVDVSTSNQSPERQRISVGLYLDTTIRVRFAFRLRPHDLILDYGNALDKEQEVIKTCMARNFGKAIEIRFLRATRRTPDSQEYLISEIELSALHTISLT